MSDGIRGSDTLTGVLFIGSLALLGVFTVILGDFGAWSDARTVVAEFDRVDGLEVGDKVLARGVEVGDVTGLTLTDDGVIVEMRVSSDVSLRPDATAEAGNSSMLGGRRILLVPGSEPGNLADDARIPGVNRPADMVEAAREALRDLDFGEMDLTEATESLQNIEKGVKEFTDKMDETMGGLGDVTEDVDLGPEAPNSMARLLHDDGVLFEDLQTTASNLREVTDKINTGEGTIGRLVNDGTLAADLEQTMADLRETLAALREGEGTLGALLHDTKLRDDLTATADNLRVITDDIREGRGTLGLLLQDESLYNDTKATVQTLRRTVEEFRETTPITTFAGIIFGAF